MAISFDKAVGFQEQALRLHSQRAEILANNIANSDTPGFKARDIDFHAVLQRSLGNQSKLEPAKTHTAHMDFNDPAASGQLLYRNPSQPAVDGNTVDTQTEIVEYSENALGFQSSFQFLNSKFKGLVRALKGDQ